MIRHKFQRLRLFNKRGISTVLGILLMVGIFFTSILPLFMYVNNVNSYYDRTVVNLKQSDQERGAESLIVYAYGEDNSKNISIFIVNNGAIPTNITRVWITRTDFNDALLYNSTNCAQLPLLISASAQETTFDYDAAPIILMGAANYSKNYFNIKVSTERGNTFSSQTNSLFYDNGNGYWRSMAIDFQIQVIVLSSQGQTTYRVEVRGIYNTTYYSSTQMSQVQGEFYCVFDVQEQGTYNVSVTKKQGQNWVPIRSPAWKIAVINFIQPRDFVEFNDNQ